MARKKENDKLWSEEDWSNLCQRAQTLSQTDSPCFQSDTLSANEIKQLFPSFVKFSTGFFNSKLQEWQRKAITDRVLQNIQTSATPNSSPAQPPATEPPTSPAQPSAVQTAQQSPPQGPAQTQRVAKVAKKKKVHQSKMSSRRRDEVSCSNSDAENIPPSPPKKKRQLSPMSVQSS
ncbi:hypothetical protein DFJ73DRAFT_758101 [Zopfochytrium polystomum]|nr:hypothetical protein DFJ73DRAFT_758101 [Zopfochytrium polystomum]